jgi:casein kinase II subunit beta
LTEVELEYIEDNFNLYGLRPKINQYSEAINMIKQKSLIDEEKLSNEQFIEVYQDAADLYGLIHSRYILTSKGLNLMRDKYLSGKFG